MCNGKPFLSLIKCPPMILNSMHRAGACELMWKEQKLLHPSKTTMWGQLTWSDAANSSWLPCWPHSGRGCMSVFTLWLLYWIVATVVQLQVIFFHTDFLQEESVTDIITVSAAKNSKSYNNRQKCHCPEGYDIMLARGKETSICGCLDGIGYKVWKK